MTATLGSNGKVRWDKPKDRLSPARFDADLLYILELMVEVRRLWEQAVDGGVYPGSGGGNGRPSSFEDTDPTASAALMPTKRQLRGAARRAATLVSEAAQHLEDAATVLHNSILRTDPEVYERDLEKRRAATQ